MGVGVADKSVFLNFLNFHTVAPKYGLKRYIHTSNHSTRYTIKLLIFHSVITKYCHYVAAVLRKMMPNAIQN